MKRVRITLEYDGTAFHGWQRQVNAVAVQNVIEEKLAVIFKRPVEVQGASRTDAGVHARGQVIAFDYHEDKTPHAVQGSLNGLLPQTIRCRDVAEVPLVFDPRRDSEHKTYRYTWWEHLTSSPFWRRYSWHVKPVLDIAAMDQAAKAIVGEHDFSSFRAVGCTAKTPVRRILAAKVTKKAERVQFEITGHAFLHQMVRILAGTLYDIGAGKRPASDMALLLEQKNRKFAGKTAPAEGLVLWEIRYGEIPRPGRKVLTHKG